MAACLVQSFQKLNALSNCRTLHKNCLPPLCRDRWVRQMRRLSIGLHKFHRLDTRPRRGHFRCVKSTSVTAAATFTTQNEQPTNQPPQTRIGRVAAVSQLTKRECVRMWPISACIRRAHPHSDMTARTDSVCVCVCALWCDSVTRCLN